MKTTELLFTISILSVPIIILLLSIFKKQKPSEFSKKENLRKVEVHGKFHYSIGYFHQFYSEGKAYIEDENGEIFIMDMKYYTLKFI